LLAGDGAARFVGVAAFGAGDAADFFAPVLLAAGFAAGLEAAGFAAGLEAGVEFLAAGVGAATPPPFTAGMRHTVTV